MNNSIPINLMTWRKESIYGKKQSTKTYTRRENTVREGIKYIGLMRDSCPRQRESAWVVPMLKSA
jgi:hypothetical protein